MNHYQVAIIGGGPGGYETAIRLSQFNISVVVFEKSKLGGTCLNHGCIPTKTLVKTADLFHEMKNAEMFGLPNLFTNNNELLDYSKIYDRKCDVVNKLVDGINFLFNKRKIQVEYNTVSEIIKKTDKFYIVCENQEVATADFIIIATGSESKSLPFLPFDNKNIYSSEQLLSMTELPKSLAIIGGGVIGCEFACIFNHLGVDVEIIEFLPEIIPTEDIEISKKLSMAMKKSGIKILTKTGVENAEITTMNSVELNLSNGKSINTEKVLVSIGRKPVFNIKTTGFELNKDNEFIHIDEMCRASEKNVFAIGDVTGKLMLAHVASKQGLLVSDKINELINGIKPNLQPINYTNIPSCIFTSPEVASCGLREKDITDSNIAIGKFPYSANGKALATGHSNGIVKTIINKDNEQILGIHIIGYLATELIAQASILINKKVKVSEVGDIIFAHPTISECLMESIEDTHKLAIHI